MVEDDDPFDSDDEDEMNGDEGVNQLIDGLKQDVAVKRIALKRHTGSWRNSRGGRHRRTRRRKFSIQTISSKLVMP